jgi:hypothetical protein
MGRAAWRVKELKQGLRRVPREGMVAEKTMEIQGGSQARGFAVLQLWMHVEILSGNLTRLLKEFSLRKS